MTSKSKLEIVADTLDAQKTSEFVQNAMGYWKENFSIDPLEIVRKFIMDKGLKLYGGLALHEHLKKHKQPIYKKNEFPDYDVFSPSAWEHAKELCDILYKKGYYFVEARSSVLNNEHHQTYKVAVDMIYILDLTQSGCTVHEIADKDCKKCGLSNKNKCISLFNHIPAVDLKNYKIKNQKVFTKTYNYENDKAMYPRKMFVCDPTWLKISMYRELTEPMANPSRLVKVATRLDKFNKYFKFDHSICNETKLPLVPIPLDTKYTPILDYIKHFVNKHKLIHYGIIAYNFYSKNKKIHPLEVQDYEVYSDNLLGALNSNSNDSDVEILLEELKNKFKKDTFKIEQKILYWKEIDINNYSIYVKPKSTKKYYKLITFTEIMECMPFIQYNKIKYCTMDRLKHIYFRKISLPKIIQMTETNYKNYECMLSNLIHIEKNIKKSVKNRNRNKSRRFVKKCEGSDGIDKMKINLLKRFSSKIATTKNTTTTLNKPKQGYITKSYPIPDSGEKFPYKPVEQEIKNYKKYSDNLDKHYKFTKKRLNNKEIA